MQIFDAKIVEFFPLIMINEINSMSNPHFCAADLLNRHIVTDRFLMAGQWEDCGLYFPAGL